MTNTPQFQVLGEEELLEFFGVDPVDRSVENGYWCYEISDERGVRLRFSFNIYERSVQTTLLLNESAIAKVSFEGADRMVVRDGKLKCEFSNVGDKTTLTVETGRILSVAWSTLRTG